MRLRNHRVVERRKERRSRLIAMQQLWQEEGAAELLLLEGEPRLVNRDQDHYDKQDNDQQQHLVGGQRASGKLLLRLIRPRG